MIVSGTVLSNAVKQYNITHTNKEGYSDLEVAGAGVSAAFASFALVVAVLFFILELIVLFFAISMAMACSQTVSEQIVNIVMAVVFTIPYVLLNTLFNPCALENLRSLKM